MLLPTPHRPLLTNCSLLTLLIHVGERLIGFGALGWVIHQYGDFFQPVQSRAWSNMNNLRLRRRSRFYFDYFSHAVARRIDRILAGSRDHVSDLDFFHARNVAHFNQTILAHALDRSESIRL